MTSTNNYFSMPTMNKEQLILLMQNIKDVEFKLNFRNIFDIDIVQSQVSKTNSELNEYDINSNVLKGDYIYNEIIIKE